MSELNKLKAVVKSIEDDIDGAEYDSLGFLFDCLEDAIEELRQYENR